jgi:hypothetical protein
VIVVEEPANANPEDQDHMEDNVDITMDEHNMSDHEHIFNSMKHNPLLLMRIQFLSIFMIQEIG